MFSAFEWGMAFRYLRARRKEGFISVVSWFSLIGILLGVATLIIVMSVMNGFRAELLGRILGWSGHIVVQGPGGQLQDYDTLAAELATVPGVTSALPLIEAQVMVTNHGQAAGALVRAVHPKDLRANAAIADHIVEGSLDDFEGRSAIAIGHRMARNLGLFVGDPLTLVAPERVQTAMGTVPRMKRYTVAAVFNIGMYEYDANGIFMPLEAAQILFRMKQAVNGVELRITEPDAVHRMRPLLRPIVDGRGHLVDWQQRHRQFFTALQVERNVMFLILTLIILVAAFNIISGMIMLVKDKGQSIAILRTMGASRGTIMRIFFIAGSMIGLIGTFAGFVLGILFCNNIDAIRLWLEGLTGTELWSAELRFLSQIPAKVDPGEVTLVVTMALILTFLATLYPAWRAARLDPVEALRYE